MAGGRWAAAGTPQRRGRHDYGHSAVNDSSRIDYSEIHANERADTCAGFPVRAREFYTAHGVPRGARRDRQSQGLSLRPRAPRVTSPPRHPPSLHALALPQDQRQRGPANRTLLEEWAYVRPYLTTRSAAAC